LQSTIHFFISATTPSAITCYGFRYNFIKDLWGLRYDPLFNIDNIDEWLVGQVDDDDDNDNEEGGNELVFYDASTLN